MTRLNTTFAGLQLGNPVIISSSGLTDTAEKNERLEHCGAGAIVLKSIFEEQIMLQAYNMAYNESPEAEDYLHTYVRSHSINEYVKLIKESKARCSIPIIASINCMNNGEWTQFSKIMQEAGADAIELNIMSIETDNVYQYGSMEQKYIDILADVKKQVSIPIIVKLAANLSNPIALINQLYANEAAGIVLFNRFYQPDIDINKMTYTSGEVLSNSSCLADRLRWTAIASADVPNIDYGISGGVSNGQDIIKSILTGASATEVCSIIYRKGNDVIDEMKNDALSWMESKCLKDINDFKGKMNMSEYGEANPFERIQFMKYFNHKKLFP